ncbi:MAG: hypothetical protein O7B24_00030, partial [Alphaproteobacteria bacterium]|nr:hypothetical protein [Alphaproteobacteria bacterium]
ITEEIDVYQDAVEEESTIKYVTSLEKLKKQGVTVRDLGDVERKKMALAIEPWVNQKAGEYEALGFPGKKTFRRLIEVAKSKGATPVHEYNIK